MQTFGYGLAADVSYGFTGAATSSTYSTKARADVINRVQGTLVGIYATSNGGEGTTPAYFSEWTYVGQGQYRD